MFALAEAQVFLRLWHLSLFLSSAYVVSPGPTSRNSLFHSVSLGFLLAKAQPIGTSAPTVRSYTLSYTVYASRVRVGATVEVKKNDLGKVSRIFFF